MLVQLDGDVTFVHGWQKYAIGGARYPIWAHTKPAQYPLPVLDSAIIREENEAPTPAFYKEFFPKLDAQIKTPRAFALLAPKGWSGERCWFQHEAMVQHGWEAIGWKESSHLNKTWVQLYMRTLDRLDVQNPVFIDEDQEHCYVGKTHKGTIPYLGCSSIISSFAKPQDKFEVPKPVGCFMKIAPEKLLHLLRQVRPGNSYSTSLLRKEGFRRIYSSPFAHYWLRAKQGVGSAEVCEY